MAHDPFKARENGRPGNGEDQDTTVPRSPPGRETGEPGLKGLCVNCGNREHCLFPHREGGIWHCEEYVEDR